MKPKSWRATNGQYECRRRRADMSTELAPEKICDAPLGTSNEIQVIRRSNDSERVGGIRGPVRSLHEASSVRSHNIKWGGPSGIVQTCDRIDPSLRVCVLIPRALRLGYTSGWFESKWPSINEDRKRRSVRFCARKRHKTRVCFLDIVRTLVRGVTGLHVATVLADIDFGNE